MKKYGRVWEGQGKIREDILLSERSHDVMKNLKTPLPADRTLDMGTEGCSHLLDDIATAMQGLRPGQTLLVIAHDPAAPLDITVWSRTTGNPLLKSDLTTNQFLLQKQQA